MATPILNLSDAERKLLEALAQRRGFAAPEDYLKALVDADAVQSGEDPLFDEDSVDIRAEFRQAWREAMADDTIPLDDVWKALNEP